MGWESILDPVLNPLLNLSPLLSVFLLSLLISLVIIIIYKFTTDQKLMKQLKEEMKKHQDEMKKVKDNPERMMSIQKDAMQSNMKYMTQSFRSTLFTFLPIIILFGWMGAHYAFIPLMPNEPFNITLIFAKETVGNVTVIKPDGIISFGSSVEPIKNDMAIFTFQGKEGLYSGNKSLEFRYGMVGQEKKEYEDLIINTKQVYSPQIKRTTESKLPLKEIVIGYKKLPILPILNWGWLGTYIVLSLIFSMSLRKLMNVY